MANYLIDKLYSQVKTLHDHEFCRFKEPGENEWESITWAEFTADVESVACALLSLGVHEKTKAAICSPNRPQALEAEFAGFMHRIASVPIYAYCSQEQFDFIIINSGTRIVYVGAREQYLLARNFAASHPGELHHIILLCPADNVIDPDDTTTITWPALLKMGADHSQLPQVKERTERSEPSDMASLIYTSGTTGDPKGVVLTHSNFEAAIAEHLKHLPEIAPDELSLSFLPMSHVFEKAWSFFCMAKGLRVAFCYDPRKVEDTLHEVQPNIMCCVPRFWEKVYTGIATYFHSRSRLQQLIIKRAFAVGAKVNLHYLRLGRQVPTLIRKEYEFWDRHIFSRVRERIGIPCPNFFPTAGAALSDKICGTMRKMGINLIFGYGMTETTATVSCFPAHDFQIGTVGTPLPMVDVKIADDGEILVKGPTITPGYYHNPAADAEAFTPDGYLRTGDAGFVNSQGALVLTHRKKDLFKTSNGKYISPQNIEAMLVTDPYIDQAAVIGDTRKYVSALIVPNISTLRKWAANNNVLDLKAASLCSNPRVVQFIMERVQTLQKNLSSFEQIKKLTLLSEPFSQESGEITNTLKLRRKVIEQRYAMHIEKMYPDEYLSDAPIFNNRHR